MISNIRCNFCGRGRGEVKKIIASPEEGENIVYICDKCISESYSIVNEGRINTPIFSLDRELPSPEEIKEYLDKYIIEQHEAKEVLSVAIYNHYKRVDNPFVGDTELKKANVLMIGPSGTGKTLLVSTVAKLLKIPFVHADATTLTEAGYIGEDVENVLDRLMQEADGDKELAQKGIIYIDEIDKKSKKEESSSTGRDVSGEGVQQALLKIVEGTSVRLPGERGEEGMFDTSNILFIVGGSFNGLDEVIKNNRKSSSIGFNATVDKNQASKLLLEVTPDDLIGYGMITEFVGRFPAVVTLHELDEEMLVRIMREPKNCLVDHYKGLFAIDGIELEFNEEYIRNIAKKSYKQKTGARGLQNLMEKTLLKTQFSLPNLKKGGVSKVIITENGSPKYIYEKNTKAKGGK